MRYTSEIMLVVVVVVYWSLVLQALHCSMTGYLTILSILSFDVRITTYFWWLDYNLPQSGILITLRLLVPFLGYFLTTKHAYIDAGNEIIHSYVWLLSDTTPNIKQWLIRNLKSTDHQSTNKLEGHKLPQLRHERIFPLRDHAW